EGWRDFRRIENRHAAARARTDVEQTAAVFQSVNDGVRGSGNGGKFAPDREGDFLVFAIHQPDDLRRSEPIEGSGSRVAMFGEAKFLRRVSFLSAWHRLNYMVRRKARPNLTAGWLLLGRY